MPIIIESLFLFGNLNEDLGSIAIFFDSEFPFSFLINFWNCPFELLINSVERGAMEK